MNQKPNSDTGTDQVSLDDEEGVKRVLVETMLGLWSTVNSLARLKPSKKERFRVTVFGSARTAPGHWVYGEVKGMCAGLTELGCDIVTGGGPGLMQAANEGAEEARQQGKAESIGVRIQLPFEQGANPFVGQVYDHGSFFTRLHHFVLMSDAYIVVPGGIGTLLEAAMIWQLLQVRQLQNVPLIFVGPMWKGLVEWTRATMLRPGFELVSPDDLLIPHCVDTAQEALSIILQHRIRQTGGLPGSGSP